VQKTYSEKNSIIRFLIFFYWQHEFYISYSEAEYYLNYFGQCKSNLVQVGSLLVKTYKYNVYTILMSGSLE